MGGPRQDPSKPGSRAYRGQPGASFGLRVLPAECNLPVPEPPPGCNWPRRSAEYKLWADVWQGPHGFVWDQAFAPSVALYVAYSVRILRGDALKAHEAQALIRLAGDLGLTPAGLRSLGYTTSMPGEAS
jgi:hypothetical protein